MIKRQHRTKKPNVGVPLNKHDPLTRGLRYAFDFNEGGGGYSVGLPNMALPVVTSTIPTDGTIGSATNVTWHPGRYLTWASSTTSYIDCGANDDTTAEVTWIARVRPTTLTGLLTLFGQNKTDGTESIDSVYLESSKLSWWVGTGSGTSTQFINGTATLSANTWYRFVGRRSGAAGAWTYTTWINEEQDDTASTATNPLVQSSDGTFRIGFAGAYTGAPFVGDYDYFFLWDRALIDADLLSISRNPWKIFEPVNQRVYFNTLGVSPPPPPSPIPVFMHHYKQQGAA